MFVLNVQPWPVELPLITILEAADGTSQEGLDMGVVLYSCSFVVISLMILSQVHHTCPIITATVKPAIAKHLHVRRLAVCLM
jgi:hypothetical protein